MYELVVVDPFGLDGRIYNKGEAVTDSSLFEAIERDLPNKTVRRLSQDALRASARTADESAPEHRE